MARQQTVCLSPTSRPAAGAGPGAVRIPATGAWCTRRPRRPPSCQCPNPSAGTEFRQIQCAVGVHVYFPPHSLRPNHQPIVNNPSSALNQGRYWTAVRGHPGPHRAHLCLASRGCRPGWKRTGSFLGPGTGKDWKSILCAGARTQGQGGRRWRSVRDGQGNCSRTVSGASELRAREWRGVPAGESTMRRR